MVIDFRQRERGNHAGQHRLSHDKVSIGLGQGGFEHLGGGSEPILLEVLQARLYPATDFHHPGAPPVLPNGLSGHHPAPQGLLRPSGDLGSEEGAQLLDPLLRGGTTSKKKSFVVLQQALFRRARKLRLIGKAPEAIVDATGLESRHVSRYFVWRRGKRHHTRMRWPKLTVACHRQSHLLVGAFVSLGPSQDSPQFKPTMRQASQNVRFSRVMGDAAYDAEHNHSLCRDELGIRSTVIPINRRRGRKWPKTRYRRQMKVRFFKR